MWIERLDTEFAKCVQRACEPANYNTYNDVHDRHLYAFVHDAPHDTATRNDAIMSLFTVIALSRLVRPTSTGGRYCAEIVPHPGANLTIRAVQISGACPDVFLGDASSDWLAPSDGLELKQLMPWISKDKKMLKRVHHAFWNHEQAMLTYYLDMRWNLVVSGLEALINVERKNSKAQFVGRVGSLAREFGIALSEAELKDAYTLRSQLAHAQAFLLDLNTVLPTDEHRPLYDKLESVLRATVKRCLLDEVFGRHFEDHTAVRAKWP